MMRVLHCTLWALLSLATTAATAAAQGTLSTQGFGYPLGGLSTHSAAMGGASGEFDHLSSRNPAALGGWRRSGLYAQYDPELRTVTAGSAEDKTTTSRFGAVAAGFAVGERTFIGLSSNSFLDRTFQTQVRSGVRLGGDSVEYTESFGSTGAIGDTRLGFSYALSSRLAVGLGLHLFTGENRLTLTRRFDDSLRFGTLDRALTLSYAGNGASAGVLVMPVQGLSLAASIRQGGVMKLRIADTVRTEAKVPNRYGLGVRVDAIPGLTLFGGADRNEWSRMNDLGSATANATDSWEYSGGVEFTGPRARALTSRSYSLGFRQRDLPFAAAGATVGERIFSGGASVPLAGGRAMLDLALQRAQRDAAGGVKERAWLLSFGLTVRP